MQLQRGLPAASGARCLPLLGALVVVPPAKNSKIHAHATSSLDTFAMHTNPSHSLLLALPLPHPLPRLQLQGVAACFLVHFTCRLFSDAMRLQKPACYVLKLVCNIFVSPTTTTAAAVQEGEREREREIFMLFLFFPFHSRGYF